MRVRTARRDRPVPLGDLPRLRGAARRTTVVRAGLALALAGTLAATVLSARSAGSGRAAVLPSGASTAVIALDLSASISGPVDTRVATTLKGIVAANQAIGLVMFSDTAYELLPPNSPAAALLTFMRYFTPVRYSGGAPVFGLSPWDEFSGGTRIAAGLTEARLSLRRAHVAHGSILLISDLDDSSGDAAALLAEARQLRKAHIPVRIVPLFADPANARYLAAIFGDNAFVDPSAFRTGAGRETQPVAAPTPWALVALGVVLVLLLAGNERYNARLDLGVAA